MGKQRVIDHIFVKGVGDIKIIYDVSGEVFKARVFERWFEDKLVSKLRKKIADEVEAVISVLYEWIPIVEVKELRSWGDNGIKSFLGFEMERYYVTKRADGRWLKSDWRDEEKWRNCEIFKEGKFEIPMEEVDRYDDEVKIFYMHYTEEKWVGLGRLIEAIDELKLKLRNLVGTEYGQATISKAGGLALSLTYKPKKEKNDGKGKGTEGPSET